MILGPQCFAAAPGAFLGMPYGSDSMGNARRDALLGIVWVYFTRT